MSKRRFVQGVVIRKLPTVPELPACIDYAEQLWEGVTRRGYGAETAGAPRESKNWYKEMTPAQRAGFDRFWAAFGYKAGKTRAAGRWVQLVEPGEYELVIAAAGKEAQRALPAGQVRKMAEGWLFEMRWQDFAVTPVAADKRQAADVNRLRAEIVGLERLWQASGDAAIEAQLVKLQGKLAGLKGG